MIKKLKSIMAVSSLCLPMLFVGCEKVNSSSDEITPPTSLESANDSSPEAEFSHSPIPDYIKDKMIGKSMPENEPINFDDLSYLVVSHYGFDNNIHIGEMIVNKALAPELIDIFKELYEKKYPIEKMRLIDEYDAIDEASMSDNNSSAFCYRTIAGTNTISNHGKGLAVDINPLQNPHVIGNTTSPKSAQEYADRSITKMGMIKEGDDCYNAFIKRGWSWGGHWNYPDYQHFEKQI